MSEQPDSGFRWIAWLAGAGVATRQPAVALLVLVLLALAARVLLGRPARSDEP